MLMHESAKFQCSHHIPSYEERKSWQKLSTTEQVAGVNESGSRADVWQSAIRPNGKRTAPVMQSKYYPTS